MSIAAALILAAAAPQLTAPEPDRPTSAGVRATATVSVTILSSARVRLHGQAVREGNGPVIHHQRRASGNRVLVEFD
jgi:hypothetical protein